MISYRILVTVYDMFEEIDNGVRNKSRQQNIKMTRFI